MTFRQYWEQKGHFGGTPENVAELAWKAATEAEREACAVIAADYPNRYLGGPSSWSKTLALRIAEKIRSRSTESAHV